jgi:PhnB protein
MNQSCLFAKRRPKNLVLSVQLPSTGGQLLIGNDTPAWMGAVNHGNALDIGLEMDIRAETDNIFAAVAGGETIEYAPTEIYTGGYFGTVIDKIGAIWMVNYTTTP